MSLSELVLSATLALPLLSYRKDLWNSDQPSLSSQWVMVRPNGSVERDSFDLQSLAGKNIAVMIHGYNNADQDPLPIYFKTQQLLSERVTKAAQPIYDAVIGILWPGHDSRLEYFAAGKQIDILAPQLREDLHLLSSIARRIDVMAHSMGNRFILEALKEGPRGKIIDNLFCFAPAIDNESMEKGEIYAHSVSKCRNVYVFHSNEDDVLSFLYPLVSLDRALGAEGSEDASKNPAHVQSIDCSAIVMGHSDYFDLPLIYDCMREELLGRLPKAPAERNLKILADGSIQPVRPNVPWYQTILRTISDAWNSFFSK